MNWMNKPNKAGDWIKATALCCGCCLDTVEKIVIHSSDELKDIEEGFYTMYLSFDDSIQNVFFATNKSEEYGICESFKRLYQGRTGQPMPKLPDEVEKMINDIWQESILEESKRIRGAARGLGWKDEDQNEN